MDNVLRYDVQGTTLLEEYTAAYHATGLHGKTMAMALWRWVRQRPGRYTSACSKPRP